MSLTPKQETFCQKYVELGNASEAYRIAYPKSQHWKDEAVNVQASILLKNSKVLVRVKELQSKLSETHDLTKDKIVNRLKQIIFDQDTISDDKINLQAINKSIEILNKMQGWNEPDKLEATHTIKKDLSDYYNEI